MPPLGTLARTPADTLRTAVALAVLAAKPTECSLGAYILDLYRAFPLPGPPTDETNELWRERALATEADRDSIRLKLEFARAELRELKRASAAAQPEARPAKRKKTKVNAASKDKGGASIALESLVSISGHARLVESFRILSSFSPGSKGERSARTKLLVGIASAIPSASPAVLPDIARLIANASQSDMSPEGDLFCIRLATIAVHRLQSGTREARCLVQAVLPLPGASSVVLSASLSALVRILSGLDGVDRRRPRLLHRDAVSMLCWAVHAALDAGAERLDIGSILLPDILDVANRAGPVLRATVLTAVERAWLGQGS